MKRYGLSNAECEAIRDLVEYAPARGPKPVNAREMPNAISYVLRSGNALAWPARLFPALGQCLSALPGLAEARRVRGRHGASAATGQQAPPGRLGRRRRRRPLHPRPPPRCRGAPKKRGGSRPPRLGPLPGRAGDQDPSALRPARASLVLLPGAGQRQRLYGLRRLAAGRRATPGAIGLDAPLAGPARRQGLRFAFDPSSVPSPGLGASDPEAASRARPAAPESGLRSEGVCRPQRGGAVLRPAQGMPPGGDTARKIGLLLSSDDHLGLHSTRTQEGSLKLKTDPRAC